MLISVSKYVTVNYLVHFSVYFFSLSSIYVLVPLESESVLETEVTGLVAGLLRHT